MSETAKAGMQIYPTVRAWLSFAWLCTECHRQNTMTWTHYETYGDVAECIQCEKAHTVKVPFT